MFIFPNSVQVSTKEIGGSKRLQSCLQVNELNGFPPLKQILASVSTLVNVMKRMCTNSTYAQSVQSILDSEITKPV